MLRWSTWQHCPECHSSGLQQPAPQTVIASVVKRISSTEMSRCLLCVITNGDHGGSLLNRARRREWEEKGEGSKWAGRGRPPSRKTMGDVCISPCVCMCVGVGTTRCECEHITSHMYVCCVQARGGGLYAQVHEPESCVRTHMYVCAYVCVCECVHTYVRSNAVPCLRAWAITHHSLGSGSSATTRAMWPWESFQRLSIPPVSGEDKNRGKAVGQLWRLALGHEAPVGTVVTTNQ